MSENTFGFGATAVEDATLPDNLEVAGEVEEGFSFTEGTGGGQYKPRVTPGPVTFRYEPTGYREEPNKDGVMIREITYTAHVQNSSLGVGRLLVDRGESETKVSYQRESDYKSPKMVEKRVQSGFERLYEALGLKAEFGLPTSRAAFVEALRGATGRYAQGSLIWRASKKLDNGDVEIFSTSPNPGRGEKPWPARGADGQLPIEVTFSDGTTKFGREEIGRLYAPKANKK